MFAIHQVGAWVARRLEYLTTNDEPTTREIKHALSDVTIIMELLYEYQTQMIFWWSHHTDAIHAAQLIDEVLQAFRDDHGGSYPNKVLSLWRKKRKYLRDQEIFATPNEKKAMIEIWERWNDPARLEKQFWGLRFNHTHPYYYTYLTEEYILQIKQGLLDWLQKRKAGEVY